MSLSWGDIGVIATLLAAIAAGAAVYVNFAIDRALGAFREKLNGTYVHRDRGNELNQRVQECAAAIAKVNDTYIHKDRGAELERRIAEREEEMQFQRARWHSFFNKEWPSLQTDVAIQNERLRRIEESIKSAGQRPKQG